MGMLPEWYSKGTNPIDNNGGFGTANMMAQPSQAQRGNFLGGDRISKLINMLRGSTHNQMNPQDGLNPASPMPQSNANPQMTPYQDGMSQGPKMGQVNNPNTMSPNGQPMPNWNRTYGGY